MKKNLIAVSVILIAFIGIFSFVRVMNENKEIKEGNTDKIEYLRLNDISIDEKTNKKIIKSYEEYSEFSNKNGIKMVLTKDDFKNNDYLFVLIENDYCSGNVEEFRNLEVDNKSVKIEVAMNTSCGVCAPTNEYYLLKFDKNVLGSDSDIELKYTSVNNPNCRNDVVYKPVIYFYPMSDMNINVKVGNPDNLLVTYPRYNNGWNVYAKRDGTIIDSNNREYYALYWEGKNYKFKDSNEGFVVKGEDTIEFLEEKLKLLGLNDRESNEFIMYWLPKLVVNKYNYIRFIPKEEIDEYMPLNIEPKADTVIRILMTYKPVDTIIDVNEQKIITPERVGFTVVEWGGSKIDS